MASIFEIVKSQVSARDAAVLYGLPFNRTGNRAFCPWHDDGKHAALAFYSDGCYCHSCNRGGDSIALTAQILGLSQIEAARQLADDFRIAVRGNDISRRTKREPMPKSVKKAGFDDARYSFLCDVVREADSRLSTFNNPDSIDSDSDQLNSLLQARARAISELSLMLDGENPSKKP